MSVPSKRLGWDLFFGEEQQYAHDKPLQKAQEDQDVEKFSKGHGPDVWLLKIGIIWAWYHLKSGADTNRPPTDHREEGISAQDQTCSFN